MTYAATLWFLIGIKAWNVCYCKWIAELEFLWCYQIEGLVQTYAMFALSSSVLRSQVDLGAFVEKMNSDFTQFYWADCNKCLTVWYISGVLQA